MEAKLLTDLYLKEKIVGPSSAVEVVNFIGALRLPGVDRSPDQRLGTVIL